MPKSTCLFADKSQPCLQLEALKFRQNTLKENTEATTEKKEDVLEDEVPDFQPFMTETFT